MRFSDRLKFLRKKRGITQVEFADSFNISKGTIAMWETGKREPDFQTLLKIASYFNVTTDYLLGNPASALSDNIKLTAEEVVELGGIKDPENISHAIKMLKLMRQSDLLSKFIELEPIDKGKVMGFVNGLLELPQYKSDDCDDLLDGYEAARSDGNREGGPTKISRNKMARLEDADETESI